MGKGINTFNDINHSVSGCYTDFEQTFDEVKHDEMSILYWSQRVSKVRNKLIVKINIPCFQLLQHIHLQKNLWRKWKSCQYYMVRRPHNFITEYDGKHATCQVTQQN